MTAVDILDSARNGLGVVVGVDGSPGAAAALRFAVESARLRGSPLTVCHVQRSDDAGQPEAQGGDRVLADVEARLRRTGGEVPVRLLPEQGHPAQVLATLAVDAELTVVGSRGRGGVTGLLLGSVSLHLVTTAPTPVVVVRAVRPGGTAGGPFAGHVVVGVDGSAASAAALEFGFAEAERRGRPLAAVHVHYLAPADTYVDDQTLELHAEQRDPGRDLLDRAVDPVAARHPRVEVKRALHHAPAAAGLLRASEGCVLLAVGRTGRSAPTGMLFGSVSQAMLHRARCPVAVVPGTTPTD